MKLTYKILHVKWSRDSAVRAFQLTYRFISPTDAVSYSMYRALKFGIRFRFIPERRCILISFKMEKLPSAEAAASRTISEIRQAMQVFGYALRNVSLCRKYYRLLLADGLSSGTTDKK